MKNRAKCKLCKDIIESFALHDFVSCKCGEISVDGGPHYYKCSAKDFSNFLRVDDDGNEIIVKVCMPNEASDLPAISEPEATSKPSRLELIGMLEEMIRSIESLPPQAMLTPINHYDHGSALLLLLSILRAES
jgi:hypothetical protein